MRILRFSLVACALVLLNAGSWSGSAQGIIDTRSGITGGNRHRADLNCDGAVDDRDLSALLLRFGQPCSNCPEDINGDGMVNDLDLEAVLTAFGSKQVFLSREEAKRLVIQEVIERSPYRDQLVALSYPYPLPVGTNLEQANDDYGDSLRVERCSWLFYLDLFPEQDFAHETLFVLVGGTYEKPVIQVFQELWWPKISGIEIYGDRIANGGSPDLFWGAYPGNACASAPFGDRPIPAGVAAEKRWAILFLGPNQYLRNREIMDEAFQRFGNVPEENSKYWSFDKASIEAAVEEANQNEASQVYVYIATHGIKRTGKLDSRAADEYIDADWLAAELAKLNACSVIVLIQACYSGHFAQKIVDKLQARQQRLIDHNPAIRAAFTSASRDKCSLSHSGGGEPAGSYWTETIIKAWGDPANDTNRDQKVDIFEAFEGVLNRDRNYYCADAVEGDPQKAGKTADRCNRQ